MDQRYYGFMPLHPLLLAATFKLLGLGLAQTPGATVLLTGLTLILTFWLGVRLFNAWVGAVAVGLLVLVRWTGLTYVQLTGIPCRPCAHRPLRPARAVPGPGGAARLYLGAHDKTRVAVCPRWRAGGFVWPGSRLRTVLAAGPVLLSIWDRASRAATGLIVVGALLPWLPYAAYVLSDLPDWRGQTAIYAPRVEVLNPAWYAANVLGEYHRYGPGSDHPGWAGCSARGLLVSARGAAAVSARPGAPRLRV